jgi:hypothetical protein
MFSKHWQFELELAASRIEPQQYNFELLELRRQREEVALLKEELLAEVCYCP